MLRAVKDTLRDAFPGLWVKYHEYKRSYVEPEVAMLPRVLPSCRTAIDVGANIGVYTRALAGIANRVHSFEPHPTASRILRHTCPKNVTVHQTALSDRVGSGTLSAPAATDGRITHGLASLEERPDAGDLQKLSVPTSTVDSFEFPDVDFVKIDVEGHELKVLDGAVSTIGRDRPTFLIECEDKYNKGGVQRMFQFFTERGYAGRFIYQGEVLDADRFELAKHQGEWGHNYVYNFFFFPGRPLI
ncbi:FkbM family methyltransferase [Bradyrhizobium sp. BR13661]|jgi:FkbM family methyltransferase|uniref:FkbM family methyltransferase n=1 Tax=Bradyrhizobium sp. BR13661 TaxID=2940622 RepID=UPI002476A75A|nr:FkbM family methyltransferase [Bradyrhizobium sp. BR13661]MDH6264378.1 FkbM family methyltransferase [Bradyrhizobium sp. BR13661]